MSGFEGWSAVWWILVLLVILATTYLYMTWPYNHFKNLGIPGPKPTPVIGNLGDLGKKLIGEIHAERVLKYGKVVGVYVGWNPHLMVADLDMLKEILIKQFDRFPDHQSLSRKGVLANSLFFEEGANWKRQRVQMSPYFSSGTLKMSFASINQVCDNLVDYLSTKCQQKEMFHAEGIGSNFALDAICATAFGIQVNSVKQQDLEIIKNVNKLFERGKMTNIHFMIMLFLPSLAKVLDFCNVKLMDFSYFEKFINELIKERRKSPQDNPDFIHILLKAEKDRDQLKDNQTKGLSDYEIICNGVLFLNAGFETTGGALSFLLYNLTVYEECQQKVYEEIKKVIGNEELTYEGVQQLTYLDMCLNETLRLYPLAQALDRKCVKDSVIKGVPIKAGTYINVPVWYLQRNPDVWENPEEFDPERFSEENKRSRDPMYHCPFGLGPRHCIGKRLAELEIKMAAVRILQKFKLVKTEKTQVPLQLDPEAFTTRSKHGIWLSLEERVTAE